MVKLRARLNLSLTLLFLTIAPLHEELLLCFTNDGFALPVYKEFNNLAGRWLVFNKDGQLINISEMTTNGVTLQPTVVPLSKEHAIAYYREMSSSKKKIYTNESFDAGKTWTISKFTKLNNPGAGISALKVKDGIILAYNDSTKDRFNLSLAYKKDGYSEWQNIYTFPNKDKHMLSYPTLIADRENLLLSFQMVILVLMVILI